MQKSHAHCSSVKQTEDVQAAPPETPKEINTGLHSLSSKNTTWETHFEPKKTNQESPQMGALTPTPLPSSSQAMQEFPCRIPTTLSLSLSFFSPSSLGLHLYHGGVEQQTQHCKGNAIHHRVKNTISNPNGLKEASRFPGLTKAAGWLFVLF